MPSPVSKFRRLHLENACAVARNSGFTIAELLIAVTIVGILAAFGLPSLTSFVRDQRVKAATSDVFSTLIYARSEAIKRNANVAVCASATGTTCANSTNWATGWIVFSDSDGDGLPGSASNILRKQDAVSGVTLTGSGTNLSYRRDGRLVAAPPNFVVSGGTGVTSRCVVMDVSGRPNVKVGC